MTNPTKRICYSDFMKLTEDERLTQSEHFRKSKNMLVPAIIYNTSTDLPELPNCKFLLHEDKEIFGELDLLRKHILRNSGKLNADEAIFFYYNYKMLNGNLKVSEFMSKNFKDEKKDGWLHIQYGRQQIY